MTHSARAFCPACNRILHARPHKQHAHTHMQKDGEAELLEIRMMLSGLAGIYTPFLALSLSLSLISISLMSYISL